MDSFERSNYWVDMTKNHDPEVKLIILVGNKADLESDRDVEKGIA